MVFLLNRAAYAGEDIARVKTNQSDRADRDCQNDSEHYRVLCHILSFVLPPYIAKKISQFDPRRAAINTGNRRPQLAPFAPTRQWPIGD
jgi:hypothetical protein